MVQRGEINFKKLLSDSQMVRRVRVRARMQRSKRGRKGFNTAGNIQKQRHQNMSKTQGGKAGSTQSNNDNSKLANKERSKVRNRMVKLMRVMGCIIRTGGTSHDT